ncbi:hypothetical protein K435DRAFT_856905 [Dendrothele bispora CBS 962.96]|uniref:Uncharacterized protein n=1 Tax=Dendrothele bispora (strain CBS 962.96) TaxID=1314807 RepID=A0A4S8M7P3_DENBC|nr:hypothetical protein K435DRAFT_856905 [Dendrothele bispora CBS 962.96]
MPTSRPFPGTPAFDIRAFRSRIQEIVGHYVPANDLFTVLVSSRGVVIGSVAHCVALRTTSSAPTGLDIAVEYSGFDLLSTFLVDKGYQKAEDTVCSPWRDTAHSVYHFGTPKHRRFGPSRHTVYVRVVRLSPTPHALYSHLLKSPTTLEMTYLTPSTWMTLYPALWEQSLSLYRWCEVVNQTIRNSESKIGRKGFEVVSSNSADITPCHQCPAANRLLTGGFDIRYTVHCIPRTRADTFGQHTLQDFKCTPIKWRFSVHCFNASCPRYTPWAIRRPNIFFAPASDETSEALTDDMCMFKEAWIHRTGLRYSLAVLMRPDTPPCLVPLPLEPYAPTFTSVDSVMSELWIPRPTSDVWSMEKLRVSKSFDVDGKRVIFTLYVHPYDRTSFNSFTRNHTSPMLLFKHTPQGMLSFTPQDLDTVKRIVYEWLDPTLEDSDDMYAGHSDWYADSEDM